MFPSELCCAQQAAPARPNILWLTCEDLSSRLGCYGDNTVPTPRIDRLAEQGVRYTRAFSCTGVCAPSRFTLITGLYPMEAGAQYMRTTSKSSAIDEIEDPELRAMAQARPLYEATPSAGVRCFTEYLREAGYYCTNNSKEDYQFKAPVTAWDDSSRKAHYRNRAPGQPFFAVFNNGVTHESGVHNGGRSKKRTDPGTVPVPSFLPDTPVVRGDIAMHYDNIIELDKWVGKMLDELASEGLAESTIVFFFGDHGDGLPRFKRWAYDSGTRVPLLVRFPDGYGAGTVDDRLLSFVDLPTTALALAEAEQPGYLRGRVVAGPAADEPHEFVFSHRDRMDDTSLETIRSVRDQRFRYVRNYRSDRPYLQPIAYRDRAATMGEVYRLLDQGALNESQWQWEAKRKPVEELYDTEADPDEVRNLAKEPRYERHLVRLRSALDEWLETIDDPLATDEIEVLKTRVWPPSGVQPTTAQPEVRFERGDDGKARVTIACITNGACLGYRIGKQEPWQVYTGPFDTDAASIEAVAHRVGWKPQRVSVDLTE